MNESITDNLLQTDDIAKTSLGLLINDRRWAYLKKRHGMTPRELQVAKLICSGFSNEVIAKELSIRHATVKTHIRNLYRKLWVHSKISMLLKFIEDIKTAISDPRSSQTYLPFDLVSAKNTIGDKD